MEKTYSLWTTNLIWTTDDSHKSTFNVRMANSKDSSLLFRLSHIHGNFTERSYNKTFFSGHLLPPPPFPFWVPSGECKIKKVSWRLPIFPCLQRPSLSLLTPFFLLHRLCVLVQRGGKSSIAGREERGGGMGAGPQGSWAKWGRFFIARVEKPRKGTSS